MKRIIMLLLLLLSACSSASEQQEISENPSLEELITDPLPYIDKEVELDAIFVGSEYFHWAEFSDIKDNRISVHTLEKENRFNKTGLYHIKGIMKYGRVELVDYQVTERIPFIEATESLIEIS
jgi:hypothetical protein